MKRLLAMSAALVLVADVARAEQASGSGVVTRLLNYEGHSGSLVILSDMQATAGFCPRNDYYILSLNHNQRFVNANYAMILGAKLSGKPIVLAVERGDCVEGLPRIKHVYMEGQ